MHIRIYLLTLFTIFTLSASLEAGPFDDLKKELNDATKTTQQKSDNEMSFPDYSPLGLRIANGEAVYSDVFYWINADGTIGATSSGWSRVPKPSRHLVYLVRKEAEQVVLDASISPEERRAAEEEEARLAAERERLAAERKAAADRIAAERKAAADRIAAERKAEADRIAAEKKVAKEAEEKRLAEQRKRQLANAYSDYVYGTREKPRLTSWKIQIKNQYLPDDRRMAMYLDFGAGVKVKAVRGIITCYDAFEDTAFSERFEDMSPSTFANKVEGWQTGNIGNLSEERPLNSVLTYIYFEPNMFLDAGRALAAGGIEKCSFTLDKAVFLN